MSLIQRDPLTSQPQYPTPVNRSNPIARGLVALYGGPAWGGIASRDALTGAAYTQTGLNFSNVVSTSGRSLYAPAVASGGTSVPTLVLPAITLSNKSYSFAGRFKVRASASPGVIVRAGTPEIVMRRNGTSYSARVGNTDFTGGTMPLGVEIDYCVSAGSSVLVYGNGQQVASGTNSGGTGNLTAITLANDPLGGGTADLDIYWFGVWNRPLSASEVAELKRNPWQLFSAPAPLWVGAISSGPSNDISATSSFGITTSAQPTAIASAISSVFSSLSNVGTCSAPANPDAEEAIDVQSANTALSDSNLGMSQNAILTAVANALSGSKINRSEAITFHEDINSSADSLISASLSAVLSTAANVSALSNIASAMLLSSIITIGVTANSAVSVHTTVQFNELVNSIASVLPRFSEEIRFSVTISDAPWVPEEPSGRRVVTLLIDMKTKTMSITKVEKSVSFEMSARSMSFTLEIPR